MTEDSSEQTLSLLALSVVCREMEPDSPALHSPALWHPPSQHSCIQKCLTSNQPPTGLGDIASPSCLSCSASQHLTLLLLGEEPRFRVPSQHLLRLGCLIESFWQEI